MLNFIIIFVKEKPTSTREVGESEEKEKPQALDFVTNWLTVSAVYAS